MVEVRPPRPLKVEEAPRGVPASGCDPKPDKTGPVWLEDPYDEKGSAWEDKQ